MFQKLKGKHVLKPAVVWRAFFLIYLPKQIIDERMIPYFKENDYYRGFDNAVDAIIQAAAGEYKADPASKKVAGHQLKRLYFL